MENGVAEEMQPKKRWNNFQLFSKQFIATPSIIALNIFIFIMMTVRGVDLISPGADVLLDWGANYRLNTLDGEPWRLFTSTFLHIGIIHLLMNMYALFYIGSLLEPVVGGVRFAAVYIACGIVASLTSIAIHDDTMSAGASGAIFGMYGIYLALLLAKAIKTEDTKKMLYNMVGFVAYNLLFGLTSGIDNAAHVGGLVTGFLIGYLCKSDLVKEEDYRKGYMNLVIMGIAVAGITSLGMFLIPNNIKYYMEQMKIFDSRQNQALEVYNQNSSGTKDEMLYEINERGIYYWEENLGVLKNLERISLPENIEVRNKQLEKYCNLRIECYRLMSKGISEETEKYGPEIEKINKEIEDLVISLRE